MGYIERMHKIWKEKRMLDVKDQRLLDKKFGRLLQKSGSQI